MTSIAHPSILAVLEVSGGAQHALLERFPWLIGSGRHADLRLEDRSVSHSHALLLWCGERGAVRIVDLNSTNGTRVNGRRVRECLLSPGARVQIGAVELRFRLRGRPSPGLGAAAGSK